MNKRLLQQRKVKNESMGIPNDWRHPEPSTLSSDLTLQVPQSFQRARTMVKQSTDVAKHYP